MCQLRLCLGLALLTLVPSQVHAQSPSDELPGTILLTRVHVGMGIDDNLGNAAMGSLETALAYAPGYETFFVGGQVGIGWDGFDGTVRWNAGATVGVFMGSITLGYVGDVTAEGTRHGAFASAQLGLHFIGFYARYHVFVEAPNSAEVGLYIGFPLRVEGDGAPRVEW